jgi:Acyl-CoA carboxylase epsilon subunit
MIQITKGNPTAEEIAALVAVLALASASTQSGPTSSTAAGWRRSAPLAQPNPAALSRRDRRWRPWCAGWSRVGPAHAPVPHRGHWAGTRNVS